MSMRTKIPSPAAFAQMARQFASASAGSMTRPTAVGFTEMLAGRPEAAIASSTRRDSSRVAVVCSLRVTLSPRTSIVAIAPSTARVRIVARASSRESPAT